jgi:hypothetical protein
VAAAALGSGDGPQPRLLRRTPGLDRVPDDVHDDSAALALQVADGQRRQVGIETAPSLCSHRRRQFVLGLSGRAMQLIQQVPDTRCGQVHSVARTLFDPV